MSNNEVLNTNGFFAEIAKKPSQRFAFVIGNGINYYFNHQVTSWNALLLHFFHENLPVYQDFLNDKDITNTEAANLIELLVLDDTTVR